MNKYYCSHLISQNTPFCCDKKEEISPLFEAEKKLWTGRICWRQWCYHSIWEKFQTALTEPEWLNLILRNANSYYLYPITINRNRSQDTFVVLCPLDNLIAIHEQPQSRLVNCASHCKLLMMSEEKNVFVQFSTNTKTKKWLLDHNEWQKFKLAVEKWSTLW